MESIQALGGNGYINDFPAGRLLRDAKLYEIGAGTQEIRRMLIGRELFEAVAWNPVPVMLTGTATEAPVGPTAVSAPARSTTAKQTPTA